MERAKQGFDPSGVGMAWTHNFLNQKVGTCPVRTFAAPECPAEATRVLARVVGSGRNDLLGAEGRVFLVPRDTG